MNRLTDNLWSPDIQPAIESPCEILEAQVHFLREVTKGILGGEIRRIHEERENRIVNCLNVIVAGTGIRQRILTATHSTQRVYPCVVQADVDLVNPVAHSDGELRDLVKEVLQSDEVRSLIASLIARGRSNASASTEPSRRHLRHRQYRPAWAGVDADADESNGAYALLCDEPQGID